MNVTAAANKTTLSGAGMMGMKAGMISGLGAPTGVKKK